MNNIDSLINSQKVLIFNLQNQIDNYSQNTWLIILGIIIILVSIVGLFYYISKRFEYKLLSYLESQKLFYNHAKVDNQKRNRIVISLFDSYEYIEIDKLLHIKSEGRYSILILSDNSKFVVSKNLGEFEKELKEYEFLRIHKSHLVNKNHIVRYLKKEGGYIVLSNDSVVPVSKISKNEFHSMFDIT